MTRAERHLALPPVLLSVRQGRLFARDVALDWGMGELADDVQLGVSELVTNAVRYAGTELLLTLRLDDELVVEVRDGAADRKPGADRPRAGSAAGSGRGLHIVEAISAEWGIRDDADGKTVWFRLPLPRSGTADAEVFAFGERRQGTPDARPDTGSGEQGSAQELQARAAN